MCRHCSLIPRLPGSWPSSRPPCPLCPQFPTFLLSGAGFRRARQAVGSETEAVVWVSRRDWNSGGGSPWRPLGRTRWLLVEVSVGNHIGYEAVHEGSVSERKGPHTCFLGHKGLGRCLDVGRKPSARLCAGGGWVMRWAQGLLRKLMVDWPSSGKARFSEPRACV
uniref:Uncharacterized protein n=1 Tax=Pipistrellus kuhlii TaxID=59472 RepID=A0A7J7YX55_PIPKU|nr:hypothetical protein mPipKuh1_009818 [Pipistrellus kuhlii]